MRWRAYLLGSIPTGFLVAKAKGIDIRSVGSGNIGATNAMRVLGKPAGIFVLLMDALKGFAACAWLAPLLYNLLAPHFSGLAPLFRDTPAETQAHFIVLAGIFAVLGHNYTCWLKFKGGKGIATTAGVYLALAPWAVLVALVVFILALLLYAICFGRLPCRRRWRCRWRSGSCPAQFVARQRDDGAGRAGHLQTQIQHPTTHVRNRKPVGQKKGDAMRILCLGAGAWGTALAKVLHENGNAVTLWDINTDMLGGIPAGPQ